MSIDIKTQTKRSTKFIENKLNVNLFCNKEKFEVGLISSKFWGTFEPRENPLISFTLEGKEFKKIFLNNKELTSFCNVDIWELK